MVGVVGVAAAAAAVVGEDGGLDWLLGNWHPHQSSSSILLSAVFLAIS